MLTVKDPSKVVWKDMPLVDIAEGNVQDVFFTIKLFEIFYEELGKLGMLTLYENMTVPMISKLAEMEYKGLPVDRDRLEDLSEELDRKIEEVEKEMNSIEGVPGDINFSSDKQIRELLFDREPFGLAPPTLTKKNVPSVAEDVIEFLLTEIREREASGK